MVNSGILYGVELSLNDLFDILKKINKKILIKSDLLSRKKFINFYALDNNDNDVFKLEDFLNEINKILSLKICCFRRNSSCCCKNDGDKIIFLGWEYCSCDRGAFSEKIKFITQDEINEVNEIIAEYIEKVPKYYLCTADCDYCS